MLSLPTRASLLAVVFAASSSLAQETMTRNYALILGGGKKKADAEAVLKAFATPKGLTPAAGYPQLVKSDDVKGLKPGFFVAVLGYCDNKGDLSSQVRTLWSAQKGSYVREIETSVANACPKLSGPAPGASEEEKKLLSKAQALEPAFDKARKVYEDLLVLNPGNKDAQQALERIMVLTTD